MTALASLIAGGNVAAPIWYRALIAILTLFLLLFHLYCATYGTPTNIVFLPIHLMTALAILFLTAPIGRRWNDPLTPASALDLACVAACVAIAAYFLDAIDDYQLRIVGLSPLDRTVAIVLILLVFEAVRRTVGWSLVVVALFFCVHSLTANYFPGVFFGPPISFDSLLQTLLFGDTGIFGIPIFVMAQYIVLFLLFGRLLQSTGAGTFFTRIGFAFFGHRAGGPAKAAVVSSGLFGTVSGSGVSNVLTTGAFTIPMMTRLGYRPAFAGGVEAAAAVGGAIMPPVMGAVAFMMAEFMGVPYVDVAIAAIIPALLYYFSIYWTVDFEARKLGLQRMDRSSLPNPWRVLTRHGYLGAPLVLIVALLSLGYSIVLVALITSVGVVLLSYTSRATRLTPSRIADALEMTGRASCSLSATCACAGLIIGAIFSTGLSVQITQGVIALAQNNLWLILLLSAVIALILGTGLTASAVYITMVATVVPLLKAAGVPTMAAHMFAFYYGVVSDITPPTALAAVAASGLARANPMSTMLQASRIGITAYLVPIAFVYSPELLMRGTVLEIMIATILVALGLLALAAALTGHALAPLDPVRRLALFAAAFLLLVPTPYAASDIAGVVLLAAVVGPQMLRRGDASPATQSAAAVAIKEAPSPLLRLPPFMQSWLTRRIAREEPASAEGVAEADVARAEASMASLVASLNDDRVEAGEAPADTRCWTAWGVLALVAIALGCLGVRAFHATNPVLWLLALLALAIFLTGGLTVALKKFVVAGRGAAQAA
jgi:TRAP transporter 4TM/12TM fusion protein